MRCKYYNSEKVVKKEFNPHRKQRYLCKKCNRRFVEDAYRKFHPHNCNELIIRMFLRRNNYGDYSKDVKSSIPNSQNMDKKGRRKSS